jgi:MoaA/NifB/PqqE/SkfB family radical SAM enzyme
MKPIEINQQNKNLASYVNYRIYNREDAMNLFKGRDLYIWGAGQKGRGFKMVLERHGFKIKAFLDSSPLLIGTKYKETPIIDPKVVLKDAKTLHNSFILTASVDKKNKEMFNLCQKAGLIKGEHFTNIQELCPYYPVIEISGICNLRCISCPMGNDLYRPKKAGFMKASEYSKIINKLVKEIPFLYLVDLYIWGEPLLNPDLPEIIKINNDLGIASGISSNLNVNEKVIEKVIKSSPAQIRVSVSGYGEKNYEIFHTGGRWSVLYKNLLLLAEYIKKYQTNTIVEVYYHVNINNLSDYRKMQELCMMLGYRIHPSIHMILPDYVMDYLEDKELSEGTKKAKDSMLVSLDDMIDKAKKEKDKSCLLKRIIPVINWDGSVLACCNYLFYNKKIADNYLDISLEEIINLRCTHPLCIKCQNYSLHRYFDPVYYSDYIYNLLNFKPI